MPYDGDVGRLLPVRDKGAAMESLDELLNPLSIEPTELECHLLDSILTLYSLDRDALDWLVGHYDRLRRNVWAVALGYSKKVIFESYQEFMEIFTMISLDRAIGGEFVGVSLKTKMARVYFAWNKEDEYADRRTHQDDAKGGTADSASTPA